MKLNLLFGLLILTQTLFAQNFTEVPQLIPFEGVAVSSIAFADVDGDGDQDVLITGLNNRFARISKLYTNDGQGNFSEVTGTPFEAVTASSIAFADVDGDNDQDVLITGSNNSDDFISKLYTNDGQGSFSEVTGTPFEGVDRSSIAFADVDGDNDQDVLITGINNSGARISKLYTNDGQGSFSEMTSPTFEGVGRSSIAFADVDGDNDQDVLITGTNNSNARISKLYTNDGMGSFSEVTGGSFEGVARSSIAFADVDGDNDQDVLITGSDNSDDFISKLYTNDGMGNFSEMTGTPFEGVDRSSIAFADVDGDNDQDVLITGRNIFLPTSSKLYINDGQGSFSEMTGTPFENVEESSIAFADVDGDNDQDVLITGHNSHNSFARISKLYTNDGQGSFSEMTGGSFQRVYGSSIAFVDVDGDKDQDVLITGEINSGAYISKLYTNDGLGNFSEVEGTPFDGVGYSSIAFADVDGDNDQDVLITGFNNSGAPISKLYTNDGMGSFSEVSGTPFKGVGRSSIAFADVDGDNDQDVLITGLDSGVAISKLYTNDGQGNFSEMTGTPFEGVGYSSIAFADVDGDNDQDVLITGLNSSYAPISKLYTNDGQGSFSEMTGTPFEYVYYSSIAFADVDGDNDQDVLITGFNNSRVRISKLYTNDGQGSFSEVTGTPFEGVGYSSVAFADVDGDNDQDVLITGSFPSSKLYINDGQGSFSEVTGTPFEGVQLSSVAFADVDGDNDQDVLITGAYSSFAPISKLYTNDGMISSSDDLFVNLSRSLTLFPNPVMSDKLNVSFNSTESNSIIIRLYDMNGRLISQQREFVGTGEQTLVVDVTYLPTGSYFLQLENGKKLGVAKFLVY